jgi:catechol 2,3-dioxygenase-like lactoylglutathione lyase family enzyme
MKTLAAGATILAAATGAASADGIPGMRGHDHTGVTVPDMSQAVAFFTDVLGCKKATSFGPFADDKGTFMQDLLGVHPKAVIEEITLVRCGFGSNIELFKIHRAGSEGRQTEEQRHRRLPHRFLRRRRCRRQSLSRRQGRRHAHGTSAGHGRSRRRPDHPLFPGALGPAVRGDQLS